MEVGIPPYGIMGLSPYANPAISKHVNEPDKSMKTIMLFGAGASIPAGIPSLKGLTDGFWMEAWKIKGGKGISKKKRAPQKFSALSHISYDQFGRSDLEGIMSLIVKLENKKFKETLTSKYPELKNIGKDSLDEFKHSMQSYIRRNCEKIKNVDYFWALEGLLSKGNPLNIFTLNYDGVIEVYCQKNNISYTDGFNPLWDPTDFTNDYQVHLFKLHGSLYWFKGGDGVFIKVPIKGLHIGDIKYLTNENVSEMMIYPELEKNKQEIVYSSLFQRFREELNKSDICVIIGYSFRDKDIRESIFDALSSKPNLWLILVNPSAEQIKTEFFVKKPEIASRVVVMKMGAEEALGERKIFRYLENLENARRKEHEAHVAQSKTQTRLDYQWKQAIDHYLAIHHHDRVKMIVEKLLKNTFDEIRGSYPDNLETILCPQSLRYVFEYHKKRSRHQLEMWKKFFIGSCKQIEYAFFQYDQNLKDHNPIQSSELSHPQSHYNNSGDYTIKQLAEEGNRILPSLKDETIKNKLAKFVQTCELLTLRKYTSPDGNSWSSITPPEILDGYKKDDLGIAKWAIEITNVLN